MHTYTDFTFMQAVGYFSKTNQRGRPVFVDLIAHKLKCSFFLLMENILGKIILQTVSRDCALQGVPN